MQDNPVPWLTDRWDSYGALTEARQTSNTGLTATEIGTTLDVLSAVVGGLANDEEPYRVRFGNGLATFTDLDGKAVTIGAAPLYDKTLNPAQRAAVLTGLAFHEVAHVRYTRRVMAAVTARWPANDPDRTLAMGLSNIAEDVYAEGQTARDFPGLGPTLPVTLDWVASKTIPQGTPAKRAKGINLAAAGARYPHYLDWTGFEAHRDWWQDWADRAVDAESPKAHVALVEEALARLREPIEQEPEPEPEPGEGGDDEGDPESTDEGEPTDEPGEGESDDDDADGDGDGKGEGDEDDESESEGDPTDGGGRDGEATDADGDSTDSDDESESDEDWKGYAEHAPDEAPAPEQGDEDGEGESNAVSNAGGGDGTTGKEPDLFVPVCPRDSAQQGTEDVLQSKVDSIKRAKRGQQGIRSYSTQWGKATVARVRMTERGKGIVGGGTTVGFIAPSIGIENPYEKDLGSIVKPSIRPDVSRALAGAITRQRVGNAAPETGHRSGTLDRTRLARVASGDCRVFQAPVAPAPQRLRVLVLLDASSSMFAAMKDQDGKNLGVSRATATAQIGVDLAGAIDMLPFCEGAVYAHGSASKGQFIEKGILDPGIIQSTIYPLWQKGEPIAYAGDYATLELSGNWDAWALRYAADDLHEAAKPGERLLIVIVSDGSPGDLAQVAQAVKDIRARNIEVVSVSVAPDLGIAAQRTMYGEDVIEFFPAPMALAKSIAKAMGKALR